MVGLLVMTVRFSDNVVSPFRFMSSSSGWLLSMGWFNLTSCDCGRVRRCRPVVNYWFGAELAMRFGEGVVGASGCDGAMMVNEMREAA